MQFATFGTIKTCIMAIGGKCSALGEKSPTNVDSTRNALVYQF